MDNKIQKGDKKTRQNQHLINALYPKDVNLPHGSALHSVQSPQTSVLENTDTHSLVSEHIIIADLAKEMV